MADQDHLISPPPDPDSRPASGRMLAGRPLSVFAVLAAGLGVLAVLTLFLLLSGRNPDDSPQPLICLPVSVAEAESHIMNGEVARLHVLTERGKPEIGPLAVTLDLDDLTCRELPKGVQEQDDFYRLVGVTTVYNQTRAGEERIEVLWEEQTNIPLALLSTPTATPLPTRTPMPPTATPVPPTGTPVPPAATPEPPTMPPVSPTATSVPATATRPPTATRVPPTTAATPVAASPAASPAPRAGATPAGQP
jgi:hypothetical protein